MRTLAGSRTHGLPQLLQQLVKLSKGVMILRIIVIIDFDFLYLVLDEKW